MSKAAELIETIQKKIDAVNDGDESYESLKAMAQGADAIARIAIGQSKYQIAQGNKPSVEFFED